MPDKRNECRAYFRSSYTWRLCYSFSSSGAITNEADVGNYSLGKKIVNSDVKQDTFRRAVGELLIGRISRRYCRVRHIACQT